MGTLDGAGLSYVTREFRETALIDTTMPELKGRFPVHLVDRVNHAQVASGSIPALQDPCNRFMIPSEKKFIQSRFSVGQVLSSCMRISSTYSKTYSLENCK